MNLCKELRETACDAGNGLDQESRDAIYKAAETIEADNATIARIWKALGITTYEDAGGKEISEIVAEKVAAVTEWQLIQTAPAGIDILALEDFQREGDDGTKYPRDYQVVKKINGQWASFGIYLCSFEPTHWMPLPAPPSPAAVGLGE